MVNTLSYTLYKDDTEHHIIIYINKNSFNDGRVTTGVFNLHEGSVNLGDIVFDNHMNQWEYTGLGDLTHKEAAEIAAFIQKQMVAQI